MVRLDPWYERRTPQPEPKHVLEIIREPLTSLAEKLKRLVPDQKLDREAAGQQTGQTIPIPFVFGIAMQQQFGGGMIVDRERVIEAAHTLIESRRQELTDGLVPYLNGLGRAIELFRQSCDAIKRDDGFIVPENSALARMFSRTASGLLAVADNADRMKIMIDGECFERNQPFAFESALLLRRIDTRSRAALEAGIRELTPKLGYPGLEIPRTSRLKYPAARTPHF